MNENQTLLDYVNDCENLLEWVYVQLSEMTTMEFSNGGDKDIRDKIKMFLGIEEA